MTMVLDSEQKDNLVGKKNSIKQVIDNLPKSVLKKIIIYMRELGIPSAYFIDLRYSETYIQNFLYKEATKNVTVERIIMSFLDSDSLQEKSDDSEEDKINFYYDIIKEIKNIFLAGGYSAFYDNIVDIAIKPLVIKKIYNINVNPFSIGITGERHNGKSFFLYTLYSMAYYTGVKVYDLTSYARRSNDLNIKEDEVGIVWIDDYDIIEQKYSNKEEVYYFIEKSKQSGNVIFFATIKNVSENVNILYDFDYIYSIDEITEEDVASIARYYINENPIIDEEEVRRIVSIFTTAVIYSKNKLNRGIIAHNARSLYNAINIYKIENQKTKNITNAEIERIIKAII